MYLIIINLLLIGFEYSKSMATTKTKSAKQILIKLGMLIFLVLLISPLISGCQVFQDLHALHENPSEENKMKFDASLAITKEAIGIIGTIATITGGIILFLNYQNAQSKLITERFSKAIEQLGNDKMEIRLGGIYALEQIAKDSNIYYWTVMEVLTSFIQERSPLIEVEDIDKKHIKMKVCQIGNTNTKNSDDDNWKLAVEQLKNKAIGKDIQAALTVIGRRVFKKNTNNWNLDLSFSNLSQANLIGANLEGVNLQGANLYKAHLAEANMKQAKLEGANFEGANLFHAQMEKANLYKVNLKETKLFAGSLKGAKLLKSNLVKANLSKDDLSGTNLSRANFQGAILKGANLKGAILSEAKNLTNEQIKLACNWQQAIYTKVHWDNKQTKFIIEDEKDNQRIIEQIKNETTSDPKEPPDCSRWQ